VIEMLFSTSLVALILSPRRLQITNTKVRSEPVLARHHKYHVEEKLESACLINFVS
jgi:hypothetical protein